MPDLELWIIYGLAFGAVLLGVQGLYWFLIRARRDKKAINRRVALAEQLSSPTEVLDTLRRERGFGATHGIRALARFEDFAVQTGLRIEPLTLLTWALGIAVGYLLILSLLGRLSLWSSAAAFPLALATVCLWLRRARARRIARFAEQFPDALDVAARGLLAGHSLRAAVALVAREMPDPVGSEFGILADEITFGLGLSPAVDNLIKRVGYDELAFFGIAINIQSQTGGNLAEVLSRLSRMVRLRTKMRQKIRALTSEGRLSGLMLSVAPFALFAIISLISPAYFGSVRDHPAMLPALIVGIVLLLIGNVVIYRMVNFKV